MSAKPEIQAVSGPDAITVHGSAVALKDRGLLITGDSGAGKSSLAVELISMGVGLVADDWVVVERGRAGGLVMSPPDPIAGLVELRGIGLTRMPYIDQAPLMAIIDLNREPDGRMPQRTTRTLLGVSFPVICGKGMPRLAAALNAVLLGGGLVEIDGVGPAAGADGPLP